jgi:excisionase family DNA binding protein
MSQFCDTLQQIRSDASESRAFWVAFFYLTNRIGYSILAMKTYSTAKVAKILGIGTETIYRWMHEGKLPTPPLQSLGAMRIRLWSEEDLAAAKKYKAEHYWGKGGRQKRKKHSK